MMLKFHLFSLDVCVCEGWALMMCQALLPEQQVLIEIV